MASSPSSSSIAPQAKYDIFLSFKGEYTHDNFISHLYVALYRKKVQTFIDDKGLKRGDEISPMLLKAIEESKILIIIFSKNYASSTCCLDELVKILECEKIKGQMVIPIFYHIIPSDVRKQTGSFEDAFMKHEECFKEMKEKVQSWRVALTEVANRSGWDSSVTKPEAKLLEEVVGDVLKKLKHTSSSSDFEGLIGLESRIQQVKSLLCIGTLSDSRVVGIWGMGGIGKTTIAGTIYNQISSEFEGFCFIANVREDAKQQSELVRLRERILSQILEEENIKIGSPILPSYIQKRLHQKRVIIVLDDVDNLNQLEFLVGKFDRFGLGSRMIITTRDKQVLCNYGVHDIYEVKELNKHEALQLFCNYAFNRDHASVDLIVLSKKIIEYAKGNPLALKVLGSSLCQKTKQDWRSAIDMLKRISNNPKIHNVLKVSYDGLDEEEKEIFLDISFFFRGWDIDCAIKILDGCFSSVHFRLSVLIDKSLITISDINTLEMHDLLQELGWKIVRQESLKEPAKRSRLSNHEDVYNVLNSNKGTDLVEGIFLDMSKTRDIHLSSRAFVNMSSLRLLIVCNTEHHKRLVEISKVHLPSGLEYLPNELRYLRWDGYPLKSLPPNFTAEHLVELKLPYSNIEKLIWQGAELAPKLKIIDLEGSKFLTVIPDLRDATKLEAMILRNCKRLRNFPQISENITKLDLSGTAIGEIPTSICKLKSLRWFSLLHCSKLKSFPEILEKMESLECLKLSGATTIKELPYSIENLNRIRELELMDLKNLKTIPSSICSCTSLVLLDLDGCSKLETLPDNLDNLKRLERLHAKRTSIRQLPTSIGALSSLSILNFSSSNLKEICEDLCSSSSLRLLDLSGNEFDSLPTRINQLSQLRYLYLKRCNMLRSLPELPLRLKWLDASYSKQLRSLTEPPSLEELNEAELEVASKRCYRVPYMPIHFIFTNCLNLNQKTYSNDLEDLQTTIERMAIASVRRCCQEASDQVLAVSISLPGCAIPNWFSHQRSGSSIRIRLSPHSRNKIFIGFALCAVITFEGSYNGGHPVIRVKYYFGTNNEKNFFCDLSVGSVEKTSREPDHILLGFSPRLDVKLLQGNYTTASFEFSRERRGPSEGSICVKCCGVYPLYAQANVAQRSISMEKLTTVNQDSCETTVEDYYDHDYADTNDGSGRYDEEQINAPSSLYPVFRITGGLLMSCCWILVICLFCGFCVLQLLELLMLSSSN